MANKNDEQIQDLLKSIEQKKSSLGTKPKATWNTNGVIDGHNINTINIETCIDLAAKLLSEQSSVLTALQFLGCGTKCSKSDYINDALQDLKLRVALLNYETEKKKLALMESKLKDLRSEDLKTQDALTDIVSALKS